MIMEWISVETCTNTGLLKVQQALLTGCDVTDTSQTPAIRRCAEDTVRGTAMIDPAWEHSACLHDLSWIWRTNGPSKGPILVHVCPCPICLWWFWCKSKMLIVQNMRPPGKMFLSFQLKRNWAESKVMTPKHRFTVESPCDCCIKLFFKCAKCHFCYKDAQLQQLHISILGSIFVITSFFIMPPSDSTVDSERVEALWNQCLFKTCK